MNLDPRFEQLQNWLKTVAGIEDYEITPASADASFRRYFRIRFDATSRIVMDAPPEQEDCHPRRDFLEVRTDPEAVDQQDEDDR